jgi:hypothetical protein
MPHIPAVAVLACAGAIMAALIHAPWATLTVVGFTYATSLLFGWKYYLELKKANAAPKPQPTPDV